MKKLAFKKLFVTLGVFLCALSAEAQGLTKENYLRDLEVLTGEVDAPAVVQARSGERRIRDRYQPNYIDMARHYILTELAAVGFDRFQLETVHINRRKAQGQNIIVEIPGRLNQSEVVILAAHYDTHGAGVPGANDNGTGVAAVLGIAREAMQAGWQPDYTLRFIFFDGEERGLLGSWTHMENITLRNQEHVRFMLNLDMIGDNPLGSKNVLFSTDSAKREVRELLESVNTNNRLGFKIGYFEGYNSDQAAFEHGGFVGVSLFEDPHGKDGRPKPDKYYHPQNHSAADRISTINLDYAYAVTELTSFVSQDVSSRSSVWKTRQRRPGSRREILEEIDKDGRTGKDAVTVRLKKALTCQAVFSS